MTIRELKIPCFHADEPGRETGKDGAEGVQTRTVTLRLEMFAEEGVESGLGKEISAFLINHGRKVQFFSRTEMEKIVHRILIDYPQLEGVTLSVAGTVAYDDQHAVCETEIERAWHTVYIGIGSNVGNREENIRRAVRMVIEPEDTHLVKSSKIYETEPVGYLEQDRFLNAVFQIRTLVSAKHLVVRLLEIEKSLKRERKVKWGPRTIDLDILFYDDIVTEREDIIIPHPRLHERLFVLKPLCDIAPYFVHPILKERCYKIMETLNNDEPDPVQREELSSRIE